MECDAMPHNDDDCNDGGSITMWCWWPVSGISSLRVYIYDVNSIHKSERKTKYFPTITDAYGGFNDCVDDDDDWG